MAEIVTKIFTITAADGNIRLDLLLARHLAIPRSAAQQLIAGRGVRVDGTLIIKKGFLVSPGQRIEISPGSAESLHTLIPRPDLPLMELKCGDGWIAVDKPPGLPVHPLHPGESETLLNAALARYPHIQGIGEGALRSGVVHRLDIDTSGVILLATKQNTWHYLRGAFQEHRAQKIYHAIVAGELHGSDRLILDLQIAQHSPARVKVINEKVIPKPPGTRRCDLTWRTLASTPAPGTPGEGRGGGRRIESSDHLIIEPLNSDSSSSMIQCSDDSMIQSTRCPHPNPLPDYRARGQERGATLVEINLGTGFLHQIRVMLAHIGHPILGDTFYGPATSDFPRQMLHARSISIGDIHAESPYPPDFAQALCLLRLNK